MTVTPTATDLRARSKAATKIDQYGRSLVLRKATSIEVTTGPDAGVVTRSPISTSSLLSDGEFLTGVDVVSLDAAAVEGLLVAGDRLRFSGHATVYVVTGGPYAASGNAIADVSITPALAADVADDEAVTVQFTGSDSPIKGVVERSKMTFVDGVLSRHGDHWILVAASKLEALGLGDPHGLELFLGPDVATAQRATVIDTEPIPSGELDAAVYLIAKEG